MIEKSIRKKAMTGHRACNRVSRGFSMVEVIMALGIMSFALLTLLALLPLGVKANKISAEETRATFLLTLIESDLRNSLNYGASEPSQLFSIGTLPYVVTSGVTSLDTTLSTGTSNPIILYIDQNEEASTSNPSTPNTFRATIIYTTTPSLNELTPTTARLLISWPPVLDPLDATQRLNLDGSVETAVSFPAP